MKRAPQSRLDHDALKEIVGKIELGWILAVVVRAEGAAEAADFDKGPDSADQGNEIDQHPSSGLVAVMPALYLQGEAAPDQGNVEDDREDSKNTLGFLGLPQNGAEDADDHHEGDAAQDGPKPVSSSRDAALKGEQDLLRSKCCRASLWWE